MKSFTAAAATFGLLAATNAAPASNPSYINDGFILNYALTLEHLEDTFYREGLAKYTEADFAAAGFDATFYKNLKEVAFDEKTHVSFLTGALKSVGITPVQECTYSFPYNSPESFIGLASVLEGVGVSAYLGAAASIADKTYLTAAGSILTVEARHNAYIRSSLKESPFPQPFDAPLDFKEVFSLAAPFIVSCPPDSPPLPLKAFPSLTLITPAPIKTGSTIHFKLAKKLKSSKVYACFAAVTGPVCSDVKMSRDGKTVSTVVPAGFYGQSYVVLSSCNTSVSDDTTLAGPAIVEIAGTAGGY